MTQENCPGNLPCLDFVAMHRVTGMLEEYRLWMTTAVALCGVAEP